MLPRHHDPLRSRGGAPAAASRRATWCRRPATLLVAASATTPPRAVAANAAAVAARRAASAAATAALAILLNASAPPPAAHAEELTLRFKASADPQIRAAQQQLVEAWALTSALFVDGEAIAKPEWHDGLSKALDASFAETSPDGVRRIEDELLARLGDPYTRVLRGKAAERLAAEEEGRVVSNGLALLPSSLASGQQQQWAVAYVAPGGPAEAAGVRVGDAVLSVDGAAPPPPPVPSSSASPSSSSPDEATERAREAFLARVSREPVALRLSRKSGDNNAVVVEARLSPAPVDVESVQWGVLRVPVASGTDAGPNDDNNVPVAYLRIAQFSQRTPEAVVAAMDGLFGGGGTRNTTKPRALLVDLRDDAGGVVEAGVEVARQLLRPGDALAVVTSRAGGATAAETASERVVLSPPADSDSVASSPPPALYAAGPAASKRIPMAVLTTHNTASTAELLAGALRDGGPGATIVGEQTYGKGRTQRVMALQNGADDEGGGQGGAATLLVSTMRFATPSGAAIDGVGLEPGVACSAPASGFEVFTGGGGAEGDESAEAEMRALFEGDACVRRAAEMLAGRVRK